MQSISKKEERKAYRKNHDASYYRHVTKRVNCTFSREEYELLSNAARRHGFKPTPFTKKAVIAYLNREVFPSQKSRADLQEIIYLLRNAGNNLNQLAARANKLKKATIFDLGKAKKILVSLEAEIKSALFNRRRTHDIEIDDAKIGELRADSPIHR